MAQMEALLKIKADVQGEGQVQALGRAIGGLSGTAGKVTGTLGGLAKGAGALSGALGSLVPLATGAGLAAMAKGAIDAADNMNDLSQKTGVSVENLSRFQQAANASGTSIEAVGGAMVKLSKGMAAGTGPAVDALKSLGLSATDANGKLKGTDQVMLEVADKFKAMPDGAQKTALALQLFGKAGADMIPLLNGGRDAVESLSATMTTKFAQGADSLNDKMAAIQSKLLELGVNLATALMPALNAIADMVINVANAFAALPAPLQTIVGGVVALAAAFVVLAPAISAAVSIAGALAGLQLGATIAGWLGAVGPAIAGITAAFSGLLAWIGSTLIPGLVAFFSGPVGWTVLAVAAVVAMCIAFREPIGKFFTWLGSAIGDGLQALWKWGEPIREFWVGVWEAVRGVVEWGLKAAFAVVYQLWVQPWVNLWNNVLREPVTAMGKWLQGVWSGISKAFSDYVSTPISKAWNALTQMLPKALQAAANGVKNAFRGVLQFIANQINNVTGLVNKLIAGFNRLPGPDIPLISQIKVPAFAAGGVVSRPTMAMVGEGGQREYIVPESKMAGASMAYLSGARGAAVLAGGGGSIGESAPQINITTGPVLQQDGQRYVTIGDLERALSDFGTQIFKNSRSYGGRRYQGAY